MRWSSLRMRSTRSSALRCPSWRRNTVTIKSRLLERLAPAGRTCSMLVAVAVMISAAFFRRERRTAAARRRRVRVLDGEPAAGDGLDKIDFGAFQVADADRIDEELDAVRFEHLVGITAVFLDHQPVLET